MLLGIFGTMRTTPTAALKTILQVSSIELKKLEKVEISNHVRHCTLTNFTDHTTCKYNSNTNLTVKIRNREEKITVMENLLGSNIWYTNGSIPNIKNEIYCAGKNLQLRAVNIQPISRRRCKQSCNLLDLN